MSEFSTSTAVHRIDATHWDAPVAPGWDIAGNANGGYLLALAARGMAEASGRPDPVTITAHYLSPAQEGPAVLDAAVVRSGKRFATVSASLTAGDRRLLQVLGTFGDLSVSGDGPERVEAAPPDLPVPDDCVPRRADEGLVLPFLDRVELRLHPDDARFQQGEPSGEPRVRGWFRLRHGEQLDTLALLVAIDAFPPTAFNARLPVAWTPTVELTAHVRARPAPGWLACAFTTRFVTGGFLEEDGEVWDATGRLVAQSRQLALVPRG